ncbi:unnamed protein product [Schistosoma turkestanicum]|nr:unnamed protein product [Schistosoma turkestanicum]
MDEPFEVENDEEDDDDNDNDGDTDMKDTEKKVELQQIKMRIDEEENQIDNVISDSQSELNKCFDSSCQSTSSSISTTTTTTTTTTENMKIVIDNVSAVDNSNITISSEQNVEETELETEFFVDKNQPVKVLGPTMLSSQSHKPLVSKITEAYPVNDPDDYVEWFPPSDQVGDGITSLNAKYGY